MPDIRQTVHFPTTASRLYEALVDPTQHAAFTGASATGEPAPGGVFTAWDAYITGRHLELLPGVRIVQAWRAADWSEGDWSIVRYTLTDTGEASVRVDLEHLGVPDEHVEGITQGWHDYYWEPLGAWLAAL